MAYAGVFALCHLAILLSSSMSSIPGMRDGYYCDGCLFAYQGSCYKTYRSRERQGASESRCNSWSSGGHLAWITSRSENDAIEDYVKNIDEGLWFIGLERETSWTSGAPLTYTNWAPGEPDGWFGWEPCAAIQRSKAYKWVDINCDPLPSICKAPCKACPSGCKVCYSSSSCSTCYSGKYWNNGEKRCKVCDVRCTSCSTSGCSACSKGYYVHSNGYACNACTSIANCAEIRCTSSSNQVCDKCMHDIDGARKAYNLTADQKSCQKVCSWRHDSNQCFPGSCRGPYTTACDCASGVTGDNCLQLVDIPGINTTRVVFQSDTQHTEDHNGFIPLRSNKAKVEWNTATILPEEHDIPYYVNKDATKLGLTRAVLAWNVFRDGSAVTGAGRSENCAPDISKDNPSSTKGLHCNSSLDFSDFVKDGDRIEINFTVENGGKLGINNYDNSPPTPRTLYYQGKTAKKKKVPTATLR